MKLLYSVNMEKNKRVNMQFQDYEGNTLVSWFLAGLTASIATEPEDILLNNKKDYTIKIKKKKILFYETNNRG